MESEERTPRRSRRMFAWLGENVLTALIGIGVGAALVAVGINTAADGGSSVKEAQAIGHTGAAKDNWLDGVSAWTVILASAPTRGQANVAVNQARRIPTAGLNLGVLHSDAYAHLHRGYWVAFAGQFDTAQEAQRAANRYRRQFPTAYQRFIEER